LIVAQYRKRKGSETRMEDKARFVFPVVITAIIVFVVSGAVTFFNIGWRNDFVDPMVVRLRHRLADRGQHRLSRDALRPQPHPAHRRRLERTI
jgi:hypothetical protein